MHLADAVPIAGVLCSNAKLLSPLSAVLRVRETATLGSLNPVPLVAVTGNNAGWVTYSATTTHDPWLLAAAGPGLLIGLFYVASIYSAACADQRKTISAMAFFYAAALAGADMLSIDVPDCSASAVGTLCVAMLMLFYASPLPAMRDALRTRSAASIHIGLAGTTLCNAGLWMTYGISQDDWHLYLPQSIGVLVAASQLLIAKALAPAADEAKAR